MRKILVPFALIGLCSLPMVACDVEDGDEDATTNTNPSGTNPTDDNDTSPTVNYEAVIVDDSAQFNGRCATSSSGAHGADIDAVELVRGSDSYLVAGVNYQPGTVCPIGATHKNPEDVKGAPQDDLNTGYVSLGGGSVTVTFLSQVFIQDGDEIIVYEVGDTACGNITSCVGDEAFSVYLANDLDCEKDTADCDVLKLSDEAGGESTISVAF